MNEFIKILLSLSVSGTLLLLPILLLKRLYRDKFSRCWQYYIWIVVALRFLLPFTPDTTIVGSMFEKFDTAATADAYLTDYNTPATVNTIISESNQTQENSLSLESKQSQESSLPQQNNNTSAFAVARSPLNLYNTFFFVWAVAALILIVRKITLYQSFTRYIKARNTDVADIKILNLLSDCMEKLNIKTSVELSYNPIISTPMMSGFFHPHIVLPIRELGDKKLSYIFTHELTHYKQKDMFYKWLVQMVVCLHWFNPFVYLLEREVNVSCELSCDEKVISALDNTARREYGDTLISFLKSDSLYLNTLASITLTEGAKQLKERLGAIMKFKKKSKGIITATVIISAAICICFCVTGAYAATPKADNDSEMAWNDGEILNNVLTEDGVYYIFCDGATENDKPVSSVSAGNFQFVLVRKDSYVSIGPFNNQKTLIEDVTKQCEYMKSLTQEEKELIIKTATEINGNSTHSDSYKKLIAYKTEGYLQQSVADFNASLASTPDELTDFLAAVADVSDTISQDDENYDFFNTTISFSSQELYCSYMGEEVAFSSHISKQTRPSAYLDQDGEIWYEFSCFVDFQVPYTINSPELITVEERDNTLLTFRAEMQDYLNSLSEAEITDGNIKQLLLDKANELIERLSTENMELSVEIYQIDISG